MLVQPVAWPPAAACHPVDGLREGWLAEGIADDLTPAERVALTRTLDLLRRLTER